MPFQLASRTITAPDKDGSLVPPIACAGADRISIGGTATAAGGSITYRLIFTDSGGVVVGCTPPITLKTTVGSPADWGTAFLGVPVDGFWTPPIPACANLAYLKADAVVGSWTIGALAYFPPGTTPPF